jgi:LAO/AO transport system kinase
MSKPQQPPQGDDVSAEHDSPDFPPRRDLTIDEYYAGVRNGEVTILARALTLMESINPGQQRLAEELLTRLLPHTGNAIRVGITGVPGVGKSTLIDVLGMHLVNRGQRVAVLAVDPSSAVSRGSILGDKTRMARLAVHPAGYVRPSPSAGSLGGVARKTRENALVCEAAGYDVILIETVGVGQSETMVADMTDVFVALMLPGAGDELQGIKCGVLELVDVIAVNKADGPTQAAAELAARQYRLALESLRSHRGEPPAVLTCSALHGQGIQPVWDAIKQQHVGLTASGQLTERRRQQNLRWLWSSIRDELERFVHHDPAVKKLQAALEEEVLAGITPAGAAARRLVQALGLMPPENS